MKSAVARDVVCACCFAGSCNHWRDFDYAMYIARTRWLLQRKAFRTVAAYGEPLSAKHLTGELLLHVGKAMPRSELVAWDLTDEDVQVIAVHVARDLTEMAR